MPIPITIIIDGERIAAELDDTSEARRVLEILPIEHEYTTWGNEIYFPIPISLSSPTTVASVAVGDLAFWPPGNAFCIFYGMTPVSTPDDIRPASPVIPLGRLVGDIEQIKLCADAGSIVRIEPV